MNAWAFFLAITAAATSTASVPIRQEHGVLLVRATVDGEGPLLFTLDPGAKDIYTSYARDRLKGRAPHTICFSLACFPAAMEYFDGDPAELDPRHDRSLGIIAGSIGPELLRKYVARIDYRSSTLTLIPPNQFQPPRDAQRLAVQLDSYGVPSVPAAVDGIGALFELDVRAPVSMLFSPFLNRTGFPRSPRALHRVQLGSVEIRNAEFRFSSDTSGKFANSEVAGLLGNDVLSHVTLTLDLPHRRAYVADFSMAPGLSASNWLSVSRIAPAAMFSSR